MRICYVHERFGSLGGAEANVQITAGELRKRGHDVRLLCGPPTGKGEARWNETFEAAYPMGGNSQAALRRVLSEAKPDVFYVHKTSDLALLEALLESGVPLVRMGHDHDIYCMRSYKYFYLSRKICTRSISPYCIFPCGAFIARNAGGSAPVKYVSYAAKKREIALNQRFHRHFVVTEYMRQELLRNGFDPTRIQILPPVPRMGDASIRSRFSDRNLIVYAGQLIRGKGVDVLLESLALVEARFECVILGEGSQKERCEALARKLGLEGKVRFAGFIPQEELRAYYADCSVVAISSVWPEPIATIGLEVMRYGLPVVAFDAGGISDWLEDGVNGFLVPWMDRRAFAARLEQLLRDKALARSLGENGLRMASERYDFDEYITTLESRLQSVAQGGRMSDIALRRIP